MDEWTYVEVLDNNRSTTIVLNDLIRSVESTTTVDVGSTRSLLEGESILTDILPPDIVESARTHAVNTFAVVWSNDNVGKGTTRQDNENTITGSTLGLFAASVVCRSSKRSFMW